MSNSSLVDYTAISPYRTSPRKHTIDAVIVHCMAGDFSVETCGNIFQRKGRNASANYGIDSTGRIGQYVYEKDRAWCSGGTDKNGKVIRVNGYSGADWDHRAISIEVANDGGSGTGWHVSDKAMESLVNLLVDICQRNDIKQLLWKNDKTLVGKIDQQNMALHRWFAQKACVPVSSEVLTRNGWKRIDEIEIGEEIACADLENLKVSFENVYDKVEVKKQDTYTNNGLTATKDHRMIFRTQENNRYRIEFLCKLLRGNNQYYIPLAGHSNNVDYDISDDMIRLIVATQADGHYMYEVNKHGEKKYYGLLFHLKKERKINRIKEILKSCQLEYTEGHKSDGSTNIRVYNKDGLNIVKDVCEKYLKNKCFTWEFIKFSKKQVDLFISELLLWDGSTEAKSYFSKDKINLDIVSAMCVLNGIGSKADDIGVRFRESPFITLVRESKRNARKLVTCVSVKTGIFIMRQNGKTFVIGNCPGDYLVSKHEWLMEQVNARLNGQPIPSPEPSKLPYKVKIDCDTLNVRKGPGVSYKVVMQVHRGEIYTITADQNGWGKLKSGAGWICLKYTKRV